MQSLYTQSDHATELCAHISGCIAVYIVNEMEQLTINTLGRTSNRRVNKAYNSRGKCLKGAQSTASLSIKQWFSVLLFRLMLPQTNILSYYCIEILARPHSLGFAAIIYMPHICAEIHTIPQTLPYVFFFSWHNLLQSFWDSYVTA